ncbi:MAG: threonine--tRNA ligase [Candidatus Hydrogenedentota bacterium]
MAHIMAQAVLEIRPEAKMAFGPPVDFGFYYGFDFGDSPVGERDLEEIENRMRKIIKEKQPFEQAYKTLDEAVAYLEQTDQSYKIEYAKELVESGRARDEELGFYTNGPFVDMCEGPHLETTGKVPKACFKLDRISGSYWRGDEKNAMLTRIYGLAFERKADLKDYIERRKLAMERDHRKLGDELDIFFLDAEVGVGLPMWMPNGAVIRDELEAWAKEEEFKAGYVRVSTPSITRSGLYERSGHLPYYAEDMYPPMTVDENDKYYLRPMNCPHHHKIFSARPHSYRDLPLRMAEYGDTFRYEKHGSLAGLLRVRAMCMNDAHIYCTPEQVEDEFRGVIDLYKSYFGKLRLGSLQARLSLSDSDSDKFVGDRAKWDRTEAIVREVLTNLEVDFEEEHGEAAFYGPKLDIQLKNLLGREETISTCQLDFVVADRFGLEYIDADGERKTPFIIHRAPLGTHERMISVLIEMYGGAFPTWMAPTQVKLIPINDEVLPYAREIFDTLRNTLFRSEIDTSNESFNKKLRKAITSKTPNIWILGGKEMEERNITWRRYSVKEQTTVSLDAALGALEVMRKERLMDNFEDVGLPLA